MTFPPPPRRPYSEAEGGGAARRPRRLATVALAVVAGAAFVAGRVTASERLIPPPWGGGGCNFLEAERSRPAVAPGAAPALRLRRPAGRRRAQRGEGTGGPRQMGTVVARRIPGERADGATLHEYFEALGNHFKNDTRVGFDPEGGARGDSVAERGRGAGHGAIAGREGAGLTVAPAAAAAGLRSPRTKPTEGRPLRGQAPMPTA